MKVVTIVRTLNEERNIRTFLEQYLKVSDHIIVSDGGSTDDTVAFAKSYPNVTVYENYPEKVDFYTHEPKQINFLISKAKELNPDWIIYDDCDCWPNEILALSARNLLEGYLKDGCGKVEVYRLYVYKGTHYFPDLNIPGQSLWAWRPSECDIHADESNPREQGLIQPSSVVVLLDKPYVLLHNFAQDKEHIQQKMDWYFRKGQPQTPFVKGCGKLEPLPSFAFI